MFSLNREKAKPFANNERILREMPWLWAIKPGWSASDRITIVQVDRFDTLDTWLFETAVGKKQKCYFHIAMDQAERVRYMEFEGRPHNIYEALKQLHDASGTNLQHIQHVVMQVETIAGYITWVYRAKKPHSFFQLFTEYSRYHQR